MPPEESRARATAERELVLILVHTAHPQAVEHLLAALEDAIALGALGFACYEAWSGVWPGFVVMGIVACVAHWAARILREP